MEFGYPPLIINELLISKIILKLIIINPIHLEWYLALFCTNISHY